MIIGNPMSPEGHTVVTRRDLVAVAGAIVTSATVVWLVAGIANKVDALGDKFETLKALLETRIESTARESSLRLTTIEQEVAQLRALSNDRYTADDARRDFGAIRLEVERVRDNERDLEGRLRALESLQRSEAAPPTAAKPRGG